MKNDASKESVISRRGFLGACIGASAGLILPKAFSAPVPMRDRILSFYNTHTGEKLTTTYWADGQYVQEGLKDIEWLLRDHRVGKAHSMDTGILDILHVIQSRIDCQRPFHIISGYRSPKTNSMLRHISSGVAKKSYHMQGRAIDIRVPRYDIAKLRKAALSIRAGGVGYYPKSNFIHVDTGRVRSW